MRIQVFGDGTMLALVNTAKYTSFVGKDWYENNNLSNHITTQTNQLSILAWGTGFNFGWIVEFSEGISSKSGFREFTGYLNNEENALFFADYDRLTMAAQFDDIKMPDRETLNFRIDISQGIYKVRVLQIADPSQENWWKSFEIEPAFIIEYERVSSGQNNMSEVPWFSL
jgi:hypothetical protein